jgi:hypothetical protein
MTTDPPASEVAFSEFFQEGYEQEFATIRRVAAQLLAHLNEPETLRLIAEANRPGVSSAHVQSTFLQHARDLGFVDESKGLFAKYPNSALRPDYFMALRDTGILLEVERGKTTINNMDLLDFWKCHLCEHANYLFLMVPRELRQNERMSPRREYATVTKRLSSFFTPDTYTNVRGLCIFGY